MTLLERVPPQSIESEQATLGAMLMERDAIAEVVDVLTPEDFYTPQHQAIFRAAVDLYRAGKVVDFVTMQGQLTEAKALEMAGGVTYLMDLQGSAPTAAAASHYAGNVLTASQQRQLMQKGMELVRRAQEEDPQSLATDLSAWLYALSAHTTDDFLRFRDVMAGVIGELEQQVASEKHTLGIPTSIQRLDELVSGWTPSTYYVIASRPNIGKTAFALQECVLAAKQGQRVAVFSLEMSAAALGRRHLASTLEVALNDVMNARLGEHDMDRVVDVGSDTQDWRFWLSSVPDLRISQLRAQARRLAMKEGGLDLVVVDYLQLVGADTKGQNRNGEITEISRGLRALTNELNCATLVLSQLNRSCEIERRAPRLSDLRDSGAIEQDADVVLFLDWPYWAPEFQQYPASKEHPNKRLRRFDVAKQRNGPKGFFDVAWSGEFQRFADLERRRAEGEIAEEGREG